MCVQRKDEELGCTHSCCDLACKSGSWNTQMCLVVYTSNYSICVWKNRIIVCELDVPLYRMQLCV